MGHFIGTLFSFAIWVCGWFFVGHWGRRNSRDSIETLAWLMGGIACLMAIFSILSMELEYLGVLK